LSLQLNSSSALKIEAVFPVERHTLSELRGVTIQKTEFFNVEASFERIFKNERND
jgi:hypothetical protein